MRIKVMNLDGKIVLDKPVESLLRAHVIVGNVPMAPCADLPPGTYIAVVQVGGNDIVSVIRLGKEPL